MGSNMRVGCMRLSLTQTRSHIPTDARAPGKFRMITVEKAEGRWLESLGLCSSLPVLIPSTSFSAFSARLSFFTYAY